MRIRTALMLAVPLVAALARGDSKDWLAYGYDQRHFSKQPNETALTPPAVEQSLHQNFDFAIPGAGGGQSFGFSASPSIYNDVAYVGALNGVFYAIYGTGPDKGKLKWQYPPAAATKPDDCGITTQPLQIGQGSGNPSGPGIASSAAIVSGVPGHARAVIFGAPDGSSNGGDGRVWALDAENGRCIWKSPVLAPMAGSAKIGYSSPVVAHDRVYIGVSAKNPDYPITIGHLFAINLADGSQDTAFGFTATSGPAGGGIWSSPAITPNGNVIVTTGNSCTDTTKPNCQNQPAINYALSMLELDWRTGKVLWQVQPVPWMLDDDPDWAASPSVGRVSCGNLAMGVQKDGYVYAVDLPNGGSHSNPVCSSPQHALECPRWSFPHVAQLPFTGGIHNDTRFIRMAAMDGDRLYVIAAGPATAAIPALTRTNRLYSLDVCGSEANRLRWILDVPNGSAPGPPSTANGVIYIGTHDAYDFNPVAHHLLAYADITVRRPNTAVCSFPGLPPGRQCAQAGFRDLPVPVLLKDLPVVGGIPGVPAISNGQVYVATAAGHVTGFTP